MTGSDCPTCGNSFESEPAVRDHAWDAHGACHRCGATFDDREALYAHWLADHDDELSRMDRNRAESTVGDLTFGDRLAHGGAVDALSGLVTRRRALAGGVASLAAVVGGGILAGALDGGDGADPAIEDHPAAAGLGRQPTLGPSPSAADGTVVAFEDPSCPSCARFERNTFPELQANLVDPGTVSFVYRGIPVVYDWGEPAVLALEATYARDPDAFWALKRYYYRAQNRIGSGNVRRATRQFLADRTAVDAAAVLADVDAGTHRDAVNADLRASRNADVRGTPTFFLFRDGSFVTEVVGPKSYAVFSNALGV